MGLKCLLGHDFTEPEVEREREEDGDEVVITVREVKTCRRCEERQIVTENKEVTSLAQLTDAADDGDRTADRSPAPDLGGAEADAPAAGTDEPPSFGTGSDGTGSATGEPSADGADPDTSDEVGAVDADRPTAPDVGGGADPADDEGVELIDDDPAPDSADAAAGDGEDPVNDDPAATADEEPAAVESEDAELLDAGSDTADPADEPGPEPAIDPGDGEPESRSADTDDGVILDDDDADGEPFERDHGEWPDVEEEGEPSGTGGSHRPWPEQEGEDEGFSAATDDEEAAGGDAAVSFGGGLTPEAEPSTDVDGRPAEDSVEYVAEESSDEDAEFIDDGPSDGDVATDSGAGGGSRERSGGTPAGTDFSGTEGAELSTSMHEGLTEYHCSECGMSRPTGESSMRAGDICPECKRGYVAERPVDPE